MKRLIFTSLTTALLISGCGGTTSDTPNENNNNGNENQQKSRGVSHLFGDIENFDVGTEIMNYTISPDGKYIYATTLSPQKIYLFSRDTESGKLTQIQTLLSTDFINGKEPLFFPEGMVVSPDGKQLYISATFGIHSDTDIPFGSNLLRFDMDDSGKISYTDALFLSDYSNLDYNVQITQDGDTMYIGANGSIVGTINRAPNGDIGLLSVVERDIGGNNFGNTKIPILSPDNKNLYISSDSFDGHLYTFDIDSVSGGLTNKESFTSHDDYVNANDQRVTGAGGTGMDITKDGKFFYSVGGYGDAIDSISIFERDTLGGLSYLKSIQAPLSLDNSNRILFSSKSHMIVSPNQKYIYTFDYIMKTLGIWKRDINNGDLNYLGQVKNIDTNHVGRLVASPDGKHLYINVADGFISYDLRADMDVKVSSSATSVKPSQNFSYTLTVQNHGPSNSGDVIITNTLPTGVAYISSSIDAPAGSCEVNGQVVTCHIDTLFTAGLYHVTIQVKAPESEGAITNQATVSANQLDTKTANNHSAVEVNITN